MTNLKNLIIIILNSNLINFHGHLLVLFISLISFIIRFNLYYFRSILNVLGFLVMLFLDFMILDLLLKLFISLGFNLKF